MAATRVYQSGNLKDINKDGDANDGVLTTASSANSSSFDFRQVTVQASPYTQVPYFGVTDTATAAYNRVLNYVGANWWTRDSVINTVDKRIIHEVRTGTGKIIAWADNPTTRMMAQNGFRSSRIDLPMASLPSIGPPITTATAMACPTLGKYGTD